MIPEAMLVRRLFFAMQKLSRKPIMNAICNIKEAVSVFGAFKNMKENSNKTKS